MKKLKTIFTYDNIHIYLLIVFVIQLSIKHPILIITYPYIYYKTKKLITLKELIILIALTLLINLLYQNLRFNLNIGVITGKQNDDYEVLMGFKRYLIKGGETYQRGDFIKLKGTYKTHTDSLIPNHFSITSYYKGKNIHGLIYIKSSKKLFSIPLNSKITYHNSFLVLYQNLFFQTIIYYLNKILWYFDIIDENKINTQILSILVLILLFGMQYYLIYLLITKIIEKKNLIKYLQLSQSEISRLSFIILFIAFPYMIYNDGLILFFLIKMSHQLKFKNKHLTTLILIPYLLKWYQEINIIKLIILNLYRKHYKNIFIFLLLIPVSLRIEGLYPLIENINIDYLKLTHFKISETMMILYFIMFILYSITKKSAKKNFYLILMFISLIHNPVYLTNNFVIFLDVGQGDAAVIKTKGEYLIIDAYQNTYDYLKNNGIQEISYMILTHSDLDHTKDAEKILKDFNVKTLIISGYDEYNIVYKNTIRITQNHKIPHLNLEILGPFIDLKTTNNNSVVLKIEVGNQTFLFTGDIEKEAEKYYLKKYGNHLKADILKVAHHGSDTSSEETFIRTVNPKIAIISVGKNNHYNMPSLKILTLYQRLGITVYQTDLSGSIIYHRNNLYKYQRYLFKRLLKRHKI